ncbi:MAG: hypothetical protein Q4A32_00395 [Lachnospiraceae bacterium]|nr:hypothetical protein [Lachnospiraceae bacterium]
MNGTEMRPLPRFLKGEPLPAGYYDPPNPYVSAPSCHVNLPALSYYAKKTGKKLTELTKEEVKQFAI